MEKDLLNEIKKTNKLLVAIATKGLPQLEKIELLGKVGFGPKEIADFIGTTNNTVSVALNAIKKKSKK
jgi:hypothetical protein